MTTIFRSPLSTRRDAPKRNPSLFDAPAQNRLTTLLAGKDQFFAEPGVGPDYDYPNPTLRKPFPIGLRTFTQSLNLELLGQDQFFSAPGDGPQYDYPNPRLRKPLPIELRTFLQPLNLLQLGRDQFFSSPGVAPVYDYPNPRLRRPQSVESRSLNLPRNPSLFPPSAPTPITTPGTYSAGHYTLAIAGKTNVAGFFDSGTLTGTLRVPFAIPNGDLASVFVDDGLIHIDVGGALDADTFFNVSGFGLAVSNDGGIVIQDDNNWAGTPSSAVTTNPSVTITWTTFSPWYAQNPQPQYLTASCS